MKMSKFISEKIDILNQRKFNLSEKEEFLKIYDLVKELEVHKLSMTKEEFVSMMQRFEFCPSIFSAQYKCDADFCRGDICKDCWARYVNKALSPFPRLSFKSFLNKNDDEITFIKTDEYKNWIYNYLCSHDFMSTEDLSYFGDDVDKKYGELLHLFLMYVADLIDETDFENMANSNEYEAERYCIRIKDKVFEIYSIVGQGSIIYIAKSDFTGECLIL